MCLDRPRALLVCPPLQDEAPDCLIALVPLLPKNVLGVYNVQLFKISVNESVLYPIL